MHRHCIAALAASNAVGLVRQPVRSTCLYRCTPLSCSLQATCPGTANSRWTPTPITVGGQPARLPIQEDLQPLPVQLARWTFPVQRARRTLPDQPGSSTCQVQLASPTLPDQAASQSHQDQPACLALQNQLAPLHLTLLPVDPKDVRRGTPSGSPMVDGFRWMPWILANASNAVHQV